MKVNINGRNMKVGQQLQARIEEKISKFDRFFGDEADAFVKVRAEKDLKIIEVTMKIRKHVYRAESSADDVFSALDQTIDVLEGQIRKHKTKIEKKIHDYAYLKEYLKAQPDSTESEEAESKIIRGKTFELVPMDSEEAISQMEMLNHSFFSFLNAETGKVCVVYKRNDGNYGLLEPIY